MKPRQKKSRTYYYFWGIATASVVIGQWYVGNGFRRMADSADGISADINLLVETLMMPVTQKSPTQFLLHNDPVDRTIPPLPISGGSPDNQVFCGVLFERGS